MRKFTFNPVATPNGGTITTQIPGGHPLRVVIMNLSPANLSLSFANGSTAACVSQDRRRFEFRNVGNGNIGWTIDSYVGSIFPGLSLVVVEVYEPGEQIVETYPSPVPVLSPPNLRLFSDNQAAGNQNSITVAVKTDVLFYLTRLEYYSTLAGAANDVTVTLSNGGFLSVGFTQQLQWFFAESVSQAIDFTYDFPSPYVQGAAATSITAVSAGATATHHILRVWGYYI